MKKIFKKTSYLLLIVFAFILTNTKVSASSNYISKIDMDVYINSNGDATVTEVWNATLNNGTEGYRAFIDLGNINIKNFSVMDDSGVTYTYLSNWNTSNGFNSKKYKNGINYTSDGLELCWGISTYGNRIYTLKYTLENFVYQYEDTQGIYFNFLNLGQEVGNVTITIRSYNDFTEENSQIWAFGYPNGTILFKDGKIVMNSNGRLSSSEYMVALVELESGRFNTSNIIDKTFDDVYEEANSDVRSTRINIPKPVMLIAIIVPIGLVIVCFRLWLKYGKDNRILVETVEFYPPNGYNSVETGYMYKGNTSNEDIVSLLIYLANKGYIKITEDSTKSKSFTLTKLKDYDGTNELEEIFMNGLFKKKTSVTEPDLTNTFYTTLNKIQMKVTSRKNRDKIYDREAGSKKKYFFLAAFFTLIFSTFIAGASCLPIDELTMVFIITVVFIGVGFGIMLSVWFSNSPKALKGFITIWGLGFGGVPFTAMLYNILSKSFASSIIYLVGIVCTIIMFILRTKMTKRTDYGLEMLGKIGGFKKFLETAEKPKLEELVMQDPTYFYNILPYTYVLGISKKWIKKFETIAYQAPDWYESNTTFSTINFNHFMTHTLASATSAMTSMPVSDGGGGSSSFGGGGSSGGSSGGGFR